MSKNSLLTDLIPSSKGVSVVTEPNTDTQILATLFLASILQCCNNLSHWVLGCWRVSEIQRCNDATLYHIWLHLASAPGFFHMERAWHQPVTSLRQPDTSPMTSETAWHQPLSSLRQPDTSSWALWDSLTPAPELSETAWHKPMTQCSQI